MTRYVVIGAGAVGGTIAARLSAAGSDVVVVARGGHADAIERADLRLRTPDGDVLGRPVVWRSPDDARFAADDVLVLAVKTQDAAGALAPWASRPLPDGRLAGEALPVLVAMNGVTGEQVALRYARRVYGVCVWTPAGYVEPGVVSAAFTPASGVFHVGRVPAELADDVDRRLLHAMADEWTAAGLDMPVVDDVMGWKWRKLLNNVNNAVDALLGDVPPDPAEQAAARRITAATRAEAEAVLEAAGVTLVEADVERAARVAGPSMGRIPGAAASGSSSRQSLARGSGSIEAAYLNGEVALVAHRAGRTAPVNERLVALAEDAARFGRRPGDWTPIALAAALGLD